jgi:hypothetical protein
MVEAAARELVLRLDSSLRDYPRALAAANAAGAVELADVPGVREAYLVHRATFKFELAALQYPEPWHYRCGAEFATLEAATTHALAALGAALEGK